MDVRVLVAGSHGKIGQRLTRILADRGDEVVAMIRDPDQAEEMRRLGGEPLVADLTEDVSAAPAGCDAIVFTAGAGPGSGPDPKQHVDRGGAEKLVDAARTHGVRRYVMVSSQGAHDPASGPEQLRPYLEAKQQADAYLVESELDWTIVRPGSLTDQRGDGRITVTTQMGGRGEVTRDDVAATLAAVLRRDDLSGVTFLLHDGETPIDQALEEMAART
jgi:uncharacterized protein YbjT (DUF2867 family)